MAPPSRKSKQIDVRKPPLKHGLQESERYFGRWIYSSKKLGGKHDSGILGGVFVSIRKNKALFKREKKSSKVLGEFVAGELWSAVCPEYSAKTFLAVHNEKISLPDKTGEHIYLGSMWIDNYKELYVDIEEQRKKEGLPMPEWWPHANGKVSFSSLLNKWTGFYSHALQAYGYIGFPQTMVTSLLLADFGVHSANVGVVRNHGHPPRLMRIDYGSSFKGITEKDIHPNSRSRHLPILQKGGGFSSNYFASYPRSAKVTPEFAAELDRVAAFNFKPKLAEALQYAGEFFGRRVFLKFAKRVGIDVKTLHDVEKPEMIRIITEHLAQKISDRQISLKDYASEIKTDLCLKKDSGVFKLKGYENKITGEVYTFKDVVKDNPEYFQKIVQGVKPVHFRDTLHKRQSGTLGRIVRDTAANILGIPTSKQPKSHAERLSQARREAQSRESLAK